jgi:hypothetical protein
MTIKSLYLASILCLSFTLSACNHDDNDKNGSNTNANTVQNGQVSQVEVVKPVVASDTNSNTINSNSNASSQTTTKPLPPLPLPPGVNILITGNTTVVRFKSGNDKNSGVSVTSSTGNIINNNTTDGTQVNNVQIVSGNNNSVVNTNSGNGVQMNIIQHTKGNHNQNQVVIEGDDNNANGAVNGNGGDADVNDKHIHTTGSIDSIVQENGVTTITITGDAHPVITQIH